ncbi:hypothetical protein M9H77_07107 [Catharanthus roseus]|uniref:Uncharacterized protein n=1 Tax=Catharanthus roseus TaxID=4058 RepID=A0ACC0BU85_CATRO|nr:hypothetical protein M9H77_07107 [Catharanthus roseus]
MFLWRFYKNKNDRWAKVLRTKYGRVSDYWVQQGRSQLSYIWRCLVSNSKHLEQKFVWKVLNRKEVLFIWLPQDILQELTKINLANGDAQTDQLHWSPSEKGQFTTTKAYLGLLNFGDEGNGHKRKQIWNFKGPSRASMLLWFIKHDRILTKSLLMQWNVSDMACCTLCERKEETALHATRDYS